MEFRLTSSSVSSGPRGTLFGTADVAVGEARSGADRRGERRPVTARTIDAVAGGIEIDEVGVDRQQVGGRVAVPFGHAGAERLQHDVGPTDQLQDDAAAGLRGHVDGHALLALQDLGPPGLGEGDDVAHRVAVELFDLDHPGAEIGEDGGAERGGVEGSELDDGHPRERRGLRAAGDRPSRRRGARCRLRVLRGPDGVAVLVDRAGRSPELGRGRRHLHQRAGLQHGPDRRVLNHHRRAVVHHLGVVEELACRCGRSPPRRRAPPRTPSSTLRRSSRAPR